MAVTVTREPIDPAAVYDLLDREGAGSVVFHYAVVKEQHGGTGVTSRIDYAAAGDTEAELGEIAAELGKKWRLADVLLVRRIGALGVGDIISLVAASSPNSEDAFAACRHGIACLKKMKTVAKKEIYE